MRTAIELIGEHGVHGFSMAQVTRRLAVAPSAPYAHFTDRADLLAAVVVHAYQVFHAELLPDLDAAGSPRDRLAAMARSYVRFAGTHRALFDVSFQAGVDKGAHPEVERAEQPITAAFEACVATLGGTAALATAIEATAHGYAMLLADGAFRDDDANTATQVAADAAATATLALIAGRAAFTEQS